MGEAWLEAEREEDEGEDTDDSDATSEEAAAPEMDRDSDSAEEIVDSHVSNMDSSMSRTMASLKN